MTRGTRLTRVCVESICGCAYVLCVRGAQGGDHTVVTRVTVMSCVCAGVCVMCGRERVDRVRMFLVLSLSEHEPSRHRSV